MKRELYSELGVNKDATKSEIKKAFRKRSKNIHPDKGGSTEQFQYLMRAYKVLSDEETRKQYDSTGEIPEEKTTMDAKLARRGALLMAMLEKAISIPDPSRFKQNLQALVDNAFENTKIVLKKDEQEIKKWKDVLKRIKSKRSIIQLSIESRILDYNYKIKLVQDDLSIIKEIKLYIDELDFDSSIYKTEIPKEFQTIFSKLCIGV